MKVTDHCLVYCDINVPKIKNKSRLITYRDFSKFNSEEVVHSISQIDWGVALQKQGVDEIEQCITANIKKVFDSHAPLVCKKVTKRKAPWRNDEIKELTKSKNRLRSKYWRTREVDDWNNYKTVRNILNRLIWRAKKSYFAKELQSADSPRDFWSCLRKCDIVSKKIDNVISSDLRVNDINEHFVQMGSENETDKDFILFFKSNKKFERNEDFDFKAVSEDEVIKAMNEIKSRAMGKDAISIQMIKAVSPYAIEAITYLVNESLRLGKFPDSWKFSIVQPLPKVTNPTNMQQLRPISILPAMSKIIEKIVIKQMNEYIYEKSLIPKLQSGFRRNHSTCTALINLFDDLFAAKDKGMYSSLVMLDYSQAFDSICHQLLLAKMNYFGFGGRALQWMESYLERRLQITKLGDEVSRPLPKQRGVPQGSCLGPILFNLYTSDLPSCIQSCTAHLYADDCQLHLSYEPSAMGPAIVQINADLHNIARWSAANGLKLNTSKCTVLHVAPQELVQTLSDSGIRVSIESESLSISDKIKTLGVILDKDLSFSDHITYSTQRALGRLRGLYRHRDLLPESAKLQIVQSLVLSVFQYCYPAYGNSISRGNMTRIQKVQNSAIRFIFNLRLLDHVSPLRDAANMFTMEDVCRMLTCCMIHKTLTLKEPAYLCERFIYREEVSQRSTRQDRTLHLPRVRREVGRRAFSYFGPKFYNDLPGNLITCKTVDSFKIKYRNFIREVC